MWRSSFIILLLLISVSARAHRSAHKLKVANEILILLSRASQFSYAQCSLPNKNLLNSSSCAQLFSTSAPYWVVSTPEARFIQLPGNWGPVCSPLMAQSLESPPLDQRAAKVKLLDDDLLATDLCLTPKQDLFSGSFEVQSQAQAKVQLMSQSQKNHMRSQFDRLRELASLKCCGPSDAECSRLMQKVGMEFCAAKSDSHAPDPCIGNGAFYSEVATLELNPGSITLSPFQDADSEKVLAHELGHACSTVKRKLEVNRGSAEEAPEFVQSKTCELDARKKRIYQKLFASQELNAESAHCFYEVAAKASRARYLNQDCAGGCAFGQLEENFAEAFSLLLFPDSEWVTHSVLEQFCMGMRDSLHAHPNDLTACLLKTPRVWTRFEIATGCKN